MSWFLLIIKLLLAELAYLESIGNKLLKENRVIEWLKKRQHLVVILLIGGAVATPSLLIYDDYNEAKREQILLDSLKAVSAKSDTANWKLDTANAKLDSSRAQIDTANDQIARLTEQLQPVIQLAFKYYPNLDSMSAIDRLLSNIDRGVANVRSDINAMRAKLLFLRDKTTISVDTLRHVVHTSYIFRSNLSTGVNDIHIKLVFDKPIMEVGGQRHSHSIAGYSGTEELGVKVFSEADKGFEFTYPHIEGGDELEIDVKSRDSINIVECVISP